MKLKQGLIGFVEGIGYTLAAIGMFFLGLGGLILIGYGILESDPISWKSILTGLGMWFLLGGLAQAYERLTRKPFCVNCDTCNKVITPPKYKKATQIIQGDKKWNFCDKCADRVKTK